jgi:quinol monooxygenase YgiN
MIVRTFRAKIRENQVSAFKRMVQEQSIPWLESSEGMLGYFPGEPFEGNKQEFVMITLWRDLESLKAFAGPKWDNPVVTEEEEPLVEEMFAEHYLRFDRN